MFDRLRLSLAQLIAPSSPTPAPKSSSRMYAMAKHSRLTGGWGTSTTSEDAELLTSLRTARNRSRALVRDAAYAKRAKIIIQNNIVGAGIGMQAQVLNSRGAMNTRINDDIEGAWEEWTEKENCHTGQSLDFADFERAIMGQVFEAGEVFIRLRYETFGDSPVPFVMELIEAERIADDLHPFPFDEQHSVRLGIEVDQFYAPVAYMVRTAYPGDIRLFGNQTLKFERVPAEQILHIRMIDRWPQTRAMPWMHAAARKLNDMDGLTEAEITAARAAACYMGFIEMPDAMTQYGEPQADGSTQSELEPAMIERLNPGEKFNFAAPNRPNAQLDPFMRMMLREVAAGTGSSYESLSRDYSQSNYSSSRLALIDDRDLWRTLQSWFIRSFREEIHEIWLRQAVLAGAISSISIGDYALHPEKYEAVRFKPRGWSWIDPTKEVDAYREAVRSGFMTVSDVIALTGHGRDLEDVLKERRYELDRMADLKLIFDTDPATVVVPPKPVSPNQPSTNPSDTGVAGVSTDTAVAAKGLSSNGHHRTSDDLIIELEQLR